MYSPEDLENSQSDNQKVKITPEANPPHRLLNSIQVNGTFSQKSKATK